MAAAHAVAIKTYKLNYIKIIGITHSSAWLENHAVIFRPIIKNNEK